jgi:tagatose-6-phosphate ketose/aldose isomerase
MLELSGGRIDCYAESPLGFRHGPKSMIDHHTLVVLLASNNSYNKQYDLDLFNELKRENKTPYLVDLSDHVNEVPSSLTDVWLSFPYIVFSQILAFYKSLSLEITPDNPCISGEVNRVVQGVTIYPFES